MIVNSKVNKEILSAIKNTYKIPITIIDDIYENDDNNYIYEDVTDNRYTIGIKHLINYIIC